VIRVSTNRTGLTVYHADVLALCESLPPASVDLVCCDPPYFRVKDEPWDRQWDDPAGFLGWIGDLCAGFRRVLKPNGSLYLFASPEMAGRVECRIRQAFQVLNVVRWVKDAGWHNKTDEEQLRSFLSPWEAVIFAEHFGADGVAMGASGYSGACDQLRGFVFEPLRAYLADEWTRAGLKTTDANAATGTQMAGHYFTRSQWALPTAKHYASLQAYANRAGGDFLRREYEDLRREYEDLRREYEDLRREYEDLRRPFQAAEHRPYTDVWDFPTVQPYPGKHCCEKPAQLLAHIIETSSRPGAVVLDPCMGSGSTGEAALSLGRSFIGGDASEHWAQYAAARLDRQFGAVPYTPRRSTRPRIAQEALAL
jgi:site-specific DNA-methyltransferase (adenine-specific)